MYSFVPTIYVLSKNEKKDEIFHVKIVTFDSYKYRSMLHRRIVVMCCVLFLVKKHLLSHTKLVFRNRNRKKLEDSRNNETSACHYDNTPM